MKDGRTEGRTEEWTEGREKGRKEGRAYLWDYYKRVSSLPFGVRKKER